MSYLDNFRIVRDMRRCHRKDLRVNHAIGNYSLLNELGEINARKTHSRCHILDQLVILTPSIKIGRSTLILGNLSSLFSALFVHAHQSLVALS